MLETSLARVLVLLLMLYFQTALAANDSLRALQSQLERAVSVQSSENCFSGTFENYSSWLSVIETSNEGNEDFSLDSFQSGYPQSRFEGYQQSVACFNFFYEVDGLNIGGFLLAPRNQPPGSKLPVIVFNRGGSATFGNMSFENLSHWVFPVVQRGYVVIGSQYRGGLGESVLNGGDDEFGGSDLNDVMALQDIIAALDVADESRIGMYGGSRGGIMTLLAVKSGFPVKAVALGAPMLDLAAGLEWRPGMERAYQRHIPGFDLDREQALSDRSAIDWVDQLDPNVPILIGQGAYDDRVNPADTLRFALELQKTYRMYKLVIYERDDHYFSRSHEEWMNTFVAWFDTYLSSDDPQ